MRSLLKITHRPVIYQLLYPQKFRIEFEGISVNEVRIQSVSCQLMGKLMRSESTGNKYTRVSSKF
jgi:hypothetical protein